MNYESHTSTHQEKRDTLILGLEHKVRFVASVHEYILSLDDVENTINAHDLEIHLWDMLESHIEQDETLSEAFNRLKEQRDLKINLATEESSFKLLWAKEKRVRSADHRKIKEEYETKIDGIENEENVLYIKELIRYITYIRDLRKDRDEYKKLYDATGGVFTKEGALARKINDFLLEQYKKAPKGPKQGNLGNANYASYITDVKFRGLGTVIIFKGNTRSKLRDFNGLEGTSYQHSSIYFCFDDDTDGSVDEHEYNHTLFGAHRDHKIMYRKNFVQSVHHILQDNVLERLTINSLAETKYNKDQHVYGHIAGYYKRLMGEIFADISDVFDNQIAGGFYGHFKGSIQDLNVYIEHNVTDEKTKELLIKSRDALIKNLDTYMAELAKIVYCSNVLQANEDTVSAFVVLGGDTRKILRYMEDKFGEKKIEEILLGFDLVKNKICQSNLEKKRLNNDLYGLSPEDIIRKIFGDKLDTEDKKD